MSFAQNQSQTGGHSVYIDIKANNYGHRDDDVHLGPPITAFRTYP
jgi:hypothetical protein